MEGLLRRLEEAEARAAEMLARCGTEFSWELADLLSLAALAGEYRVLIGQGGADRGRLEEISRRARALLLPKGDEDRLGALLVFDREGRLAKELREMYARFAERLHCSADEVRFGDGSFGLCIRAGDLAVCPHWLLKHEAGLHCAGEESCAVEEFPLREDVPSDGYEFEAILDGNDRRLHRFPVCVRVTRGESVCESSALRSAAQNRRLALAALAARTGGAGSGACGIIRDYDFSCGAVRDRRLEQTFSVDDLQPLFESLLLAE